MDFTITLIPNMTHEITSKIPPPAKSVKVSRLTAELKAIEPGHSVLLDDSTAYCLRAYFTYKKIPCVQRKEGSGLTRVWRLS